MPHYYDRDTGLLLPSVELKTRPGEWREPDLRDARKVNALVSVTTIISELAKPGLVKWQVEQGIKAAFNLDDHPSSVIGEQLLTDLAYVKSLEYTHWTADYGLAIHWLVNNKLRAIQTLEIPPLFPNAEEVADGFIEWSAANGFEWELTEHRFLRPDLGMAGTVDLMGTWWGDPVIADLKTQSLPISFYDPDYGLQLSGYSLGCDLPPDIKRVSLIANRDNPGEVHPKLWPDNQRYDEMFMHLMEFWMLAHKYDPRAKLEEPYSPPLELRP